MTSQNPAFWIAIGDLHESAEKVRLIPEADRAQGIIVTGDLTNVGGEDRAKRVLQEIEAINPVVYAQIGNMDKKQVQDYLEKSGKSIHATGVSLTPEVGLAGAGYSLPTPFGTPSEVPENTLSAWLDQAIRQIEHLPRTILAVHNPPFKTVADRLADGTHVGSPYLRELIERRQPDVVLTGHIHEAVGQEKIGDSKIINPGTLASGGYILIRLREGELEAELRSL